MRIIPLTQGKEALVDDCDYEYLMQWKWRFEREGHRRTGYAVALTEAADGRHHLLYAPSGCRSNGLALNGKHIDHVDGTG